jgi:hypothetical protein
MRIDRREWLEKYETTNLEFYYGSRLHEPVKVWTIDFEKVKCGDRQESFGTKLAPNVEK